MTCRGNERRKIFLYDDDRYRFLKLLAESLETHQVVLFVYVLMDNHFHLVLQTTRANLSEFMRRFNICYTRWFHYHHGTCGHLYQGRYKALLVDADNYLVELSRYVHLNPIRVKKFGKFDYQKRWQHVGKYRWSSLPGYVTKRRVVDFVNYNMVLDMVGGRRAYQRFVQDGLKEGVKSPFEDIQYQMILGDNDFVTRVKSEYIQKGSLREQPMYRNIITDVIEPEALMSCVAKALGIDVQSLKVRLENGVERGIVAELLYRYSDITQREIGKLLGGIDYTSVSMLRRRLKTKMANNKLVREKYAQAEQCLRGL